MSTRKLRRAVAHAARKAARKAGFPIPQPTAAALPEQDPPPITKALYESIPEPGFPFPSLKEISPARLSANRANARRSTGLTSAATKSISSQNHTIHGLARHSNGTFKLLSTEDPAGFDSFKQSLIDEHQPSTETESILVNAMTESHWLAQRAQHLQDTCTDPDTGAITDDKKFSLYMRYQTTHTRAFHKSLNGLLKLRSERRKAGLGVEAQTIAREKHEMKKQSLYWDILKKDVEACRQLSSLATQNIEARKQNPGFESEYETQLAKHDLKRNSWEVAIKAS